MTGSSSPTVLRRSLGLRLRLLREGAGLSVEQVAERMEIHRTTLSRIENGHSAVKLRDLRVLLDMYGADAQQLAELEQMARAGRQSGWWTRHAGVIRSTYATYIGFEAGATELLNWESVVVPGLLQTEDYARQWMQMVVPRLTPDAIDLQVRVRMQRQERLHSGDLALVTIIDESVLHRPVGGADVWSAQLKHLAESSRKPNISIQVLPYNAGAHPGALGSFVCLRFAGNPPIAYVENIAGDLYLDGSDAERYVETFHALARAAHPESTTRTHILGLAGKGDGDDT